MTATTHKITKKITGFINFITRADVFSFALLWLMFLLISGTIAQKSIGIYEAGKTYFSSYIIWIGGILPLPGTYSMMAFVFFALALKLFTEKWEMNKAGIIIVHLGALFLLFGGFLTSQFAQEGSMTIREGEESNFISDYHEIELAITSPDGKETVFTEEMLHNAGVIKPENAPFSIEITDYFKNCSMIKRENSDKEKDYPPRGIAAHIKIINAGKQKDDAQNRAGIAFIVKNTNENIKGSYIALEYTPEKQLTTTPDGSYSFEIRKKRTYLPFSIALKDFERQLHPGTDMAKSYSSEVVLIDNGLEWKSTIKMNAPLRYKGYTFYQSSFIEGDNADTTILSVVKNMGRMFPYISSIIMCIGLLIHCFQKLPAAMKYTNTENKKTTKKQMKK